MSLLLPLLSSFLALFAAYCECQLTNLFSLGRIIRLSSPNLNNMIILGGALIYVILVAYSVPVTTELEAKIACSVSYIKCMKESLRKREREKERYIYPL